jgi:hypothetical protein
MVWVGEGDRWDGVEDMLKKLGKGWAICSVTDCGGEVFEVEIRKPFVDGDAASKVTERPCEKKVSV